MQFRLSRMDKHTGSWTMKKKQSIREKQVENTIRESVFEKFDCTEVIRNIDFAVKARAKNPMLPKLFQDEYFLWAEAKTAPTGIYEMLAQLILTIGESGTIDDLNPPAYLGCFDSEKIAFVPYHTLQSVFGKSDINWKATPSDHTSQSFKNVCDHIRRMDESNPDSIYRYSFQRDTVDLAYFIEQNFVADKVDVTKIRIDKNNFVVVYNRWLNTVRPTIRVDWEATKRGGIIDADFYLADLLSDGNQTIKDKLFVVLRSDRYLLDRHINERGLDTFSTVDFTDGQRAHTQFWMKYERPPLREYWDYIVERRDLLVPQDVRERKGSFFTPRLWAELSQQYIADALGVDWQDEYYVWNCAAGTGNLLAGLTNKYNIWASTIDQADVDVMKDRIRNGANLLESHVFQFDFLNDEFSKLPEGLREIIKDPEKRRRLVVYINPPYAEAASATTKMGTGRNKDAVASGHRMSGQYMETLGRGINEMFAQFLIRIYIEIPSVVVAVFSTPKYVNSQNFSRFRDVFLAECKTGFVCKSDTFDNVNGAFPICFLVWDTSKKTRIESVSADILIHNNDLSGCHKIGIKQFHANEKGRFIIDWLRKHFDRPTGLRPGVLVPDGSLAFLRMLGTDFQNNAGVFITSKLTENDLRKTLFTLITKNNLMEMAAYFAVRKVIPHTWLNNSDQFLWPMEDTLDGDRDFLNDCLAFTLFHDKNRVRSADGANHWIPFREAEVDAKDKFDSSFMADYIGGKVKRGRYAEAEARRPLVFSAEAAAVFDAGRELWRHYHAQPGAEVNASLYDIREHFKGRGESGRMNASSEDGEFNRLDAGLRAALKVLAKAIEPKIYRHGFLKG
jgi:hypothetical protein